MAVLFVCHRLILGNSTEENKIRNETFVNLAVMAITGDQRG